MALVTDEPFVHRRKQRNVCLCAQPEDQQVDIRTDTALGSRTALASTARTDVRAGDLGQALVERESAEGYERRTENHGLPGSRDPAFSMQAEPSTEPASLRSHVPHIMRM